MLEPEIDAAGEQEDPSVAELENQAHRACAELRFAEGLRRGWEEARAEAVVQEAVLLAWMEGARGSAVELRELTMQIEQGQSPTEELESASAATLGIWRAGWQVASELPPLNSRGPRTTVVRPIPAILASINRDVCSFLVASGQMPSHSVAVPSDPLVLQRVIHLASDSSGSATVRAGEILRLMLTEKPFVFGNLPTGLLFVKWFLATSGVEPTGVAVLSERASQGQQEFSALMELGSADDWHRFLLQSLIDGCEAGKLIARSVQAGQTLDYSPK